MILGRVVGTVVATHKNAGLSGSTLQLVQAVDPGDLTPKGSLVVAVDSVGAGEGEIVLVTSGSSARQTRATESKPVDAVIVAIVDEIELEGRKAYRKQ